MKTSLYNLEGKAVGEVELDDTIFGRAWNASLVRQALLAQEANRRDPLAHAKTRAEVRGGGKKPWKQKHTGRARHGSIRSPIWKGGGVTHGPRKDRDFSQKINKQMKRIAIHTALSRKLKDGELKIVDAFALKTVKTKTLAKAIGKIHSLLLVAEKSRKEVGRMARNIPKVKGIPANGLNVQDILKHRAVYIEASALPEIK